MHGWASLLLHHQQTPPRRRANEAHAACDLTRSHVKEMLFCLLYRIGHAMHPTPPSRDDPTTTKGMPHTPAAAPTTDASSKDIARQQP